MDLASIVADNWTYIAGGAAAGVGTLGAVKSYLDILKTRNELKKQRAEFEERQLKAAAAPSNPTAAQSEPSLILKASRHEVEKYGKPLSRPLEGSRARRPLLISGLAVVAGVAIVFQTVFREMMQPVSAVLTPPTLDINAAERVADRFLAVLDRGDFDEACREMTLAANRPQPPTPRELDTYVECIQTVSEVWTYARSNYPRRSLGSTIVSDQSAIDVFYAWVGPKTVALTLRVSGTGRLPLTVLNIRACAMESLRDEPTDRPPTLPLCSSRSRAAQK